MENPKFSMFKSGISYYWNLKARNGEKILHSEAYTSKQSCQSGIVSVKANAPYENRYERKTSTNNQFYFVLKAANYEIIGVGETYTTAYDRDRGIEAVKYNAPSAPIEDLT